MVKAQLKGLMALCALLCAAKVYAQTFSYQGFLVIGGSPATGAYDFRFRLFDAATEGVQLGSTLTRTSVQVIDGHYTVALDFGSQWTGAARWLEIAYRPVGSSSYTTLSPRQAVNPFPYALYAYTAGTASPVGAAGGDLSGSYPSPTVARLQGRAVSSAAPADGQVLKWNAANSRWEPATDLRDSFWQSSGTGIFYSGNVGIGATAESSSRLTLWFNNSTVDQATLRLHEASSEFSRLDFTNNASTTLRWRIAGKIGGSRSDDHLMFWHSTTGAILNIRGNGRVGIGVPFPEDALHVAGNIRLDGGFLRSWGAIHLQPDVDGTGDDAIMFLDNTGNVTLVMDENSRLGVGVATPSERLDVNGNIRASGIFLGNGSGLTNVSAAALQGRPVSSTAPTNNQVLKWNGTQWAPASDESGSLTLPYTGSGSTTSGSTLNPSAVFRISNTATAAHVAAIYGHVTGTTARNHGVFGRSDSPSGRGVYGLGAATTGEAIGVHGRTESVQGIAVKGYANATTGVNYGLWGETASNSGVGSLGLAVSTTGETFGAIGISRSSSGTGVFGWASAATGLTYGVEGWSDSAMGRGVFGWALGNTGSGIGVDGWSNGNSEAIGVRGWARALSGTTYGVVGISDSASGYGVFSIGSFAATGLKAFQIDHPLSPETHYLNHFCAEAPEPYNIYSGVVQLDGHGEAWVQLPDYFEAINRDPRYVLTAVGAPMPNLHVAVEIQNNRFKIAGGAPHTKVSWEVKAVRNDRYVQQRGFRTVEEKPQEHQGKYLHPELYGQPRERGILFALPSPQTPHNQPIQLRAE